METDFFTSDVMINNIIAQDIIIIAGCHGELDRRSHDSSR